MPYNMARAKKTKGLDDPVTGGEQATEKTGDEAVHSAMRTALSKSGIRNKQDVERMFGEAAQALNQLSKLAEEAGGVVDVSDIKNIAAELRKRAQQDGTTLFRLLLAINEIERVPNWQASFFADQHQKARFLFDEIANRNPYGVEVLNKMREDERLRRKEELVDDINKIREGTISLHEALTTKPEAFFIGARVEFEDRRLESLPKERRIRRGWVRLQGRRRSDGELEARVVGTTGSVRFLQNFSTDKQTGREIWVKLTPPHFRNPGGEPYFHPLIRLALKSLYDFEEERLKERARVTASPQDILNGKDGLAIIYHNKWRDFKTNKVGPIKLELEARGGKVKIIKIESQVHEWGDLVGQEFELAGLDPRVTKIIKEVAEYQGKRGRKTEEGK